MAGNRQPILFCCTHSAGEAATSVAIAGELARRGVPDLWFAGDDVHREAVAALSAASDVAFAGLGDPSPRVTLTALDDETYARIMQPSRTRAIRARIRQLTDVDHHFARYRALSALVEEIRPALMVVNRFCLYAIQVAATRGIPFVITAPCLPSSLLEADLPRGYPMPSSGLTLRMTRRQKLANRYFRAYQKVVWVDREIISEGVRFSAAMTELGIDRATISPRFHNSTAELLLCFSVFGLDYPFPVRANLRLLGAMIPPPRQEQRDRAVHDWLDRSPSVVYAAFGSVIRVDAEAVRNMLEVVRRLGGEHQVLWVLARELQERYLPAAAELPPNLRIEEWVHDQHGVLAHPNVRAFFTHGGSNSFHEGIWFGKPLLVRPVCIDQFDHAARAVDAGVGLAVDRPHVLDPGDVHAKLVRLLTESAFTQRAQHFAEVQRAAGGIAAAGDLVLGLLGAPPPVARAAGGPVAEVAL